MYTTDAEFDELLALDHELPGVEFKGCGLRSDRRLFPRVVRAVLGMANHSDGGRVILGVPEVNGVLERRGLTDAETESWSNFDHVATLLGNYAEPSIRFDLKVFERDGRRFAIIGVDEFEEVPVICKADEPPGTRSANEKPVLRRGACYVRSRRKPGTDEVQSYEDMRALIDLAVDKGVHRFVQRATSAGINVITTSAAERFGEQRHDLE